VNSYIATAYRIIIPVLLIFSPALPGRLAGAPEKTGDALYAVASESGQRDLPGTKGLVLPPRVEKQGTGPFYSGNRIISVGLTMAEVEVDCGKPA
jgi:hypothetical protein